MSLCLNCGDLKVGAFCPCPTCQAEAKENSGVGMAFSDHFLDWETLQELGKVLKQIRAACNDDDICHWAFMQYVSQQPSSVVKVSLPTEVRDQVILLLQRLSLPEVAKPESQPPPAQLLEKPDETECRQQDELT